MNNSLADESGTNFMKYRLFPLLAFVVCVMVGGLPLASGQDFVAPVTVNGDPGGANVFRVNGGMTASGVSGSAYGNCFGDTIIPGLGPVGIGPWYPGTTVIGSSGTDKLILGYLKSSSNRATIGAHASGLNAWAPLSLAGSSVEIRAFETLAMTINGSGNVGIGTAYPANRLQVTTSGIGNPYIAINETGANPYIESQRWSGTGTTYAATRIKTNNQPDLIFENALAGAIGSQTFIERMRIDAAGNVGIGTTTPASKLDVVDSVNIHSGVQRSSAYTIGSASSPLYEVLGVQGTPQGSAGPVMGAGGFGIVSGSNQASPVVWVYNFGGQNAFRVIAKGYNTSIATDPVLLNVDVGGNVGIGTTTPTNKLTVIGTISAKEIKVTTTGADYVFENDYKLRPLAEVEQFIAEHKHLPEMPSAKAMQADGLSVSEVVTKQLAKIEELTLYVITSDRERRAQADRLAALEKQVAQMAATNAQLADSLRVLVANHVPPESK